MTYQDFLHKQDSIYSDFRSYIDNARSTGCTIPLVEKKTRYGFIVSFDFGAQLGSIYSTIVTAFADTPYNPLPAEMLHSTLTISKDDLSDSDLDSIQRICQRHMPKINELKFEFTDVLLNGDSVILASTPNSLYWDFCTSIVDELNSDTSMGFRLPKMSHITLARTNNLEAQSLGPDEIAGVIAKLGKISLPITLVPTDLHIGKFRHDETGFYFDSVDGN